MPEFPHELEKCAGFQWDAGNTDKNWDLHQVSAAEAEQVFFNRPVLVVTDEPHSQKEPRFAALGQTNEARLLVVVFTVRQSLIRVISARDQSRKERRIYAQAQVDE